MKSYEKDEESGCRIDGLDRAPISEADKMNLQSPFFVKEIKRALFQCSGHVGP